MPDGAIPARGKRFDKADTGLFGRFCLRPPTSGFFAFRRAFLKSHYAGKRMSFVHLHVHSHFSLLEGLGKINELLDRAKALGMDTMALTDYGNLYGAVELATMAKERDMKVIIGCEMFIAPGGMENQGMSPQDKVTNNLTLLVKNDTGYHNLMQMVTIGHLDGMFLGKPRVDHAVLRSRAEGLIALSGCIEGEVPQAIIKGDYEGAKKLALLYRDIFGSDNYYLEIQHHPRVQEQMAANRGLIRLSQETGIPLVATGDVHSVMPEDSASQDILLCIKDNRKVYENDRRTMTDFDHYLKSPDEMKEAFSETPEAVENTLKIAKRCEFKLKLGDIQLPHYPLPEGETPASHLRKLTEEGLVRRFGDKVTAQHRERMEYELGVIEKMGYPDYFLIVQDFVNWARSKGIVVGPGRGSAAGSFVSYLTGITNIDPIEYTLLFERFLNPERVSMPDVDMDFADDRRDEVIEYCRNKYGWDHVAQIITFGTMAARAAIRDVGRALGLSYGFCDRVAKMIPMFSSIAKTIDTVPEFKDLYETNSDARNLIDNARKLEGVCRHASVHACGVVITKNPVVEYTPMQRVTGDEHSVCTQYSSSTKTSYVEKVGLLKMDFLGLKNLTIIQNTLNIIRKTHGLSIDIESIPLDDAAAYELLQKGHTTGVFQLESNGMKRYLKQLKPTVLEDVIAMVALYRPGPMEWIPDFIDGKHGKKKVKYLHPKLEPILANTYGVAVYQEQVMQIARDLAGFSLGEADILRKAMGKKILELIKEQKIKFVDGCVKNGINRNIGEKVFEFIEPFAGYGFNRSHAACYALIGYQTAYLKAHYPAAFMAALLTSDQDNTDRIAIEVGECKDMGIEVLAPDVNESFEAFASLPDKATGKERIRVGLNAIKNVGKPVAKAIVAERKTGGKYASLADLIERVRVRDLNKKSIEALAKVGALDELAERNEVLENIETLLQYSKSIDEHKTTNQESLFVSMDFSPTVLKLRTVKPAAKSQKLQWEKDLLGLYISDHPTSEYRAYLESATTAINKINADMAGKRVTVGGILQTVKKIYVKDQKAMAFATIENLTGKIELIIFPRKYEETQNLWQPNAMVVASGKVSDKDGEMKILVDAVQLLTEQELETLRRMEATRRKYVRSSSGPEGSRSSIHIAIPNATTKTVLKELSDTLAKCEAGDRTVYITVNDQDLRTSHALSPSDSNIDRIETILGRNTVRID